MDILDIINYDKFLSVNLIPSQYTDAKPFKYVVIDNFFNESFVNRMINEFPQPRPDEIVNKFGAPSLKHMVSKVQEIGTTVLELDNLISTPEFLSLVEETTLKKDPTCDPDYYGGGTGNHLNGPELDPHVDFNLLRRPRPRLLIICFNRVGES